MATHSSILAKRIPRTEELLERTPKKKKDVLFIIGDWHAKVVSPDKPRITGKFGHRVKMKEGKG